LQVSPNAEDEIIQAAYRRLAQKWHPDRNPGDPSASEHMKLLNEAYAVLSDPQKRREYDSCRRQSASARQAAEQRQRADEERKREQDRQEAERRRYEQERQEREAEAAERKGREENAEKAGNLFVQTASRDEHKRKPAPDRWNWVFLLLVLVAGII